MNKTRHNKISSIAFIGAGNMSCAIIIGLLESGFMPSKIWATRRNTTPLTDNTKLNGINVTSDNIKAALKADIVVIGVKPLAVKPVIEQLAIKLDSVILNKTIVSIMAGITSQTINNLIQHKLTRPSAQPINIIRAMPNTPCLVKAGVVGIYTNNPALRNEAELLFAQIAQLVWVETEDLIDSITAISGSGPAYFFYFIESLINTAVQIGLTEQQAVDMLLQTGLGAIKLVKQTLTSDNSTKQEAKDISVLSNNYLATIKALRQSVTSNKGTTEAAINEFEAAELDKIISKAVIAAKNRATELSQS